MKEADAKKLYCYGFAVDMRLPRGIPEARLAADVNGRKLPVPEAEFRNAVMAWKTGPRSYEPADPRMILHFRFADGSNPFVCYGRPEEILAQLERWGRNYEIACEQHDGRILYALLSEKPAMVSDL